MKTGISGLDRILYGGFLYHNCIIVKGPPGSGKTTLGIQAIINGATMYDEPGIIVLFEQFPQQLYRDLESYSWDIEELLEGKKIAVVFAQVEELVSTDQVSDSLLVSKIHDEVVELGAKRIFVDSVSHFLNVINPRMDKRELLLRFINALKSIGLTPLLSAEMGTERAESGYEEYLSDCVLYLTDETGADKTFPSRFLRVRKTRGHPHIRGQHPYRIGSQGIEIYPHILPKAYEVEQPEAVSLEKVSSGIGGLDELLDGGYTQGTSTLVAGMPGTYKTTLCLEFLEAGCREGEVGCLITFNEHPNFLVQTARAKGIDVLLFVKDGSLIIRHFFPKDFYMDELRLLLEEGIAQHGIRRLVIDGINEMERSIEDPASYKDFIAVFLSLFVKNDITVLCTQKLDRFTSSAPLTDIKYAAMFDGIIYLGTLELESSVRKVISVLKMRGGDYSSDLREITCKGDGLEISDKFVGLSGILAGNPQGYYKKTVEEILQPLYFIDDFLNMAMSDEVEEQQRKKILENIKGESTRLIATIRDYFDLKESGEGDGTHNSDSG